MPRNNRRRRNPGDRIASRPRYGSGSKSDSSSDEFSHPVSQRITTARNPVSYHLPSNDFSEEESSGGWSSNADFSGHCDEEMVVQEVTQHPIETIQEQAESVEDGLLLVSDDENDMVEEDDEDYLSADSALRVHRGPTFAEPPLNSYELFDGTNLETMDAALGKPDFPAIPSSVAYMEQRMDQFDTSEPSMDDSSGKCYDSRYDGSLHDLTQGLHLSYSSHGQDDDNNDDSSSSIDEMKGYLSTGDLRCPNIFLKPNVGERPPTPPSPSRKSAQLSKSKVSGPMMARIPSQDENDSVEHSIALVEIQEESSEITWMPPSNGSSSIPPVEYVSQVSKQETEAVREIKIIPVHDPKETPPSWDRPESALPQNYHERSEKDYNDNCEADYGPEEHDPENYFAYDTPPSVYHPTHSLPDGSGFMTTSHADELSDAMRLLVENQTKSRRMVSMLIVALICALVALAAVAGGVVALLLSGGDEPATSSVPLPPPPVAAAAPSPMVDASLTLRKPIAVPQAASLAPMVAPAPMAVATTAPISAPVALPPVIYVAPTKPPTRQPSLRPVTAAPVSTNAPVTPVAGGSVPTTPAPVAFGSVPATPTGSSPLPPSTAVPTAASIKIP